jgi:hypothetical protein
MADQGQGRATRGAGQRLATPLAAAGEVKSLAGTVATDAERLDEHVERFLRAVRAA